MADLQRLRFELLDGKFCRPTSAKAVLAGTRTCQIRCLIGDTNGNGTVNTVDMAMVRERISTGSSIDASTYLCDVNLSATITIVDMALIKSKVGNEVP